MVWPHILNFKAACLTCASLSCICGHQFWYNSSVCVCVCMYSRNDFPRVAQRYGTTAAHTRHPRCVCSVLPSPTFSDTAITDRHSDATIFQLRAHWVRISSSELTGCGYPGLLNLKKCSNMGPQWESNPRLPACKASTLSTRPGSPLVQ